MRIVVVGTGFIGGVLGRALTASGQDVTFASRHPDDDDVAAGTKAAVAPVGDALGLAEVIVLAVPGAAVGELTKEHGGALAGKLVIDATNQMGEAVANARASLPAGIRYARAFNTMGGENMADPVFPDGQRADMFFSAPEEDRSTVEAVISGVGLRPIYVGHDQEALIDAVFQLWVALAFNQGRGRRMALKLLEG
jgi:8-hydroxy-5-deazaflavin:NADPH oxidoreductase